MERNNAYEKLARIGYALSNIRDVDLLLNVILRETMDMVRADSGTIYLRRAFSCSSDGGDRSGSFELEFRDVQNRSLPVDHLKTERIVAGGDTVAGYCARSGSPVVIPDAYALSGDEPYSFSREFDRATGYSTRSIMALPMKNKDGEVIGVVTLYNKRRDGAARIRSWEESERHVIPFNEHDILLGGSIAAQAAVALENARLYRDLHATFDGLVRAAVSAVESRDPATAGHSTRVAVLAEALADAVDRCADGNLGPIRFDEQRKEELRYACLLHDFGKIGVREAVLVKGRKLFDHEFRALQDRIRYARTLVEAEILRARLGLRESGGLDTSADEALKTRLAREKADLDECLELVQRLNRPSVSACRNPDLQRLRDLGQRTYRDSDGVSFSLMTERELQCLSVSRGSLTDEERQDMESHVDHTFEFLSKIPWSRDLAGVPAIAAGHHEMLDGSGYGRGLTAEQIPYPTRIMAVCDIFDALTASDRPYKKSVPMDRALEILRDEARRGRLDSDLVSLFVEKELYRLVAG